MNKPFQKQYEKPVGWIAVEFRKEYLNRILILRIQSSQYDEITTILMYL